MTGGKSGFKTQSTVGIGASKMIFNKFDEASLTKKSVVLTNERACENNC